MPVISEKVETIVFEALRNAYDRKCGGSPSVLQKVLDQKFEDELSDRRGQSFYLILPFSFNQK